MEKKINKITQDYEDDFKILRDQIDQLNDTVKQLEKGLEAKDYTI